MTTLTVLIDERSRRRCGAPEQKISFEDLRLRIIGAEASASLSSTNRTARKAGLHKLTKKEIETEIKVARNGSRRS